MAQRLLRLRVLLAHNDRFLLKRLMDALDVGVHVEVVGYADDGQAAVELAASLRPDVIVMAVGIPGIGAIEAAHRIREELPLSCLLLSSPTPADHFADMRRAGAMGIIDEDRAMTAFVGLSIAVAGVINEQARLRRARAVD
jgi:two-component system response regulator DesR